jgi:hypothetical protein
METGVIEGYSASASGSSTRAKRRMADAIRMVLIKIYLIIRSYFLILTGCFNLFKSWGSVFRQG